MARARLHVSNAPDSLPCREEEFIEIEDLIRGNLQAKTGSCIYISGVPGTGKTATVHRVSQRRSCCLYFFIFFLSFFQTSEHFFNVLHQVVEALEKDFDFVFVDINGMRLSDPQDVYSLLYKGLTGKKASNQQSANLLEKRFSPPAQPQAQERPLQQRYGPLLSFSSC